MIQYDMLSKRLITLLREDGQTTKAAELEAYKAELIDETNGADLDFWKNLAKHHKLAGKFEDILSGKKVWKPKLRRFKIVFK